MRNYDIVLQELDRILSNTSGFYSDGFFQENGITVLTDIEQDHLISSPFSFNFEG